jgi:hypothetical protein
MRKILRLLTFWVCFPLAGYFGFLFLRWLFAMRDFGDPAVAGFHIAATVWGFRCLSAVGAVVSATVAGVCFMG